MLFNSYLFIFLFLPITLFGFHLLGSRGDHNLSLGWLIVASLIFYAWWNPVYVILIIASILFNFSVALFLQKKSNKVLLAFGIIVNLTLLVYYKYANFFVENLNILLKGDLVFESVILPLAISFFTFQQITYLVDIYQQKVKESSFLNYTLFVVFFPQLIAGPIVHHNEMMPQFLKDTMYKLRLKNLTIGLTIFFIGLFKKVVLADGISVHANSVFQAAELGVELTFFESWGGVLAYSLQLYFDFSGYSDMAIGLARMFGITLPINFFSPYKSTSIIEFWRRWHITLSRFLRDSVYIPLGGNRLGLPRRYFNLTFTMLLGGLWHGAGWTFIVWGALHGFYLIINHGWLWFKNKIDLNNKSLTGFYFSWFITFFFITIAWVVFRAETINGAIRVYEGMFMFNGISIPQRLQGVEKIILNVFPGAPIIAGGLGSFGSSSGMIKIILLLFIACKLPNTLEWLQKYNPAIGIEKYIPYSKNKLKRCWNASNADSLLVAIFIYISFIYMSFENINEFLYFNF